MKNLLKNLKYYAQLVGNEQLGSLVYVGKNQRRTNVKIYNFVNYFDDFILNGG